MKRLVFLLLILASTAFSAEKVTIEADTVDTPEQSVYHAKGNVRVFQGEKKLCWLMKYSIIKTAILFMH